MKNQKIRSKGQSSMEYLVNYGWAILVITGAIIVLWQLGIFKLGGTTGPGYSGFGEVDLAGFSYNANGIFECTLINNAGGDITINNVTVKLYDTDSSSPANIPLSAGEPGACPPINTGIQGSQGDRYDLILVIGFTDETTGVDHRSAGKVWGNYE